MSVLDTILCRGASRKSDDFFNLRAETAITVAMRVIFAILASLGAVFCSKSPSVPVAPQSEDAMMAHLKDPSYMGRAQLAFHNVCSRCHGDHGEGGIGPNLTDNYWIHGDGNLMTLVHTIQKGAPDMGMPAWEKISPQEEIELAALYVYSIKGTNPAHAKAPQGDLK